MSGAFRSESSVNHRDPSNFCWSEDRVEGRKDQLSLDGTAEASDAAKFVFQLEPKVIANV